MSQRASTEVVAQDTDHSILRSHCRNTGVHHVGLHAKDPAASAAFYCDILGMKLVGEGRNIRLAPLLFYPAGLTRSHTKSPSAQMQR